MSKKITLSDVAAYADTSVKTASRVINGDEKVAPETRMRVEAAVLALGYRVDLLARSLRKGVDDVIAVVVPSIGDKFFATAIQEIEAVALERDTQIIIASNHPDPAKEKQIIRQLEQRRVSGLVIVPNSADYSFMSFSPTPVVFFDRVANNFEADVVRVDDIFGAQLATEHLISQGHRRIAVISDSLGIKTAELRVEGYKKALQKNGIPIDNRLIQMGAHTVDDGERTTQELLINAPDVTAILSLRSLSSMGTVRALHAMNRIDIALISYGDFEMAKVISPKISVIDHSPRELGRLVAHQIFKRIDGDVSAPQEILGTLSIIRRGSAEISPKEVRSVVAG
jgi:LacI family transcriptional regulator